MAHRGVASVKYCELCGNDEDLSDEESLTEDIAVDQPSHSAFSDHVLPGAIRDKRILAPTLTEDVRPASVR